MTTTAASAIIEMVGPEQWERYKALRLAALQEDPRSFYKLLSEEIDLTEVDWRARLGSAHTWLAVLDGVDVGMVTSAPDHDDPNAAHLSGLWVARSARRSRVAERLSVAVVDHARSSGFGRVVLWVADANAGVGRLYAGLGFTRTGRTNTFWPPRDTYTEWELELAP